MFLLACGGSEGPSQTITEAQLKSYFPYSNGDRIVFFNDLMGDVTYTVLESTLRDSSHIMNVNVTMVGANYMGEQLYYLVMNAKVTDNKIIKIDFFQGLESSPNANELSDGESFVYDVSADGELPSIITLSKGSVIQRDKGITSFIDFDSEKWYFKKRL
jgi:hypothetical protein